MSDQGREIYCHQCGEYLGVIRDAKLRKGIVYLCAVCTPRPAAQDSSVSVEALSRLFGMK